MTTKHTGGPAFPAVNHPDIPVNNGMSLRDYFAAKVLQGFMVRADGVNDLDDEYLIETAMTCYRMADAMLAAREST